MNRAIFFIGVALFPVSASGAVPKVLDVQGALANAGGPVPDGAYTLTFGLYGAESGGPAIWTEPVAALVQDGVFVHALGSVVPLVPSAVIAPQELWLGIKVETDPELPRVRFASVAFALFAEHASTSDTAATAAGLSCSACVPATALTFDPVTGPELADALAGIPTLDSVDGLLGGALLSDLDLSLNQLKNTRLHNAAAAPYSCSPTTAGGMYFDTARALFFGCDGTRWIPFARSADGKSAANPGLSCKALLDGGASDGDGTYWLDPDGVPHDDAFQVHCDMTSAGGGWTLVAYNFNKSRSFLTGTYHAVAGSLIPATGFEAALDPVAVGLTYTQIAFSTTDPQWTSATRSYNGFWVGDDPKSTYDLKSNTCQLLSRTSPTQWDGQLVYFAGNGANDDGCSGGGSVFATGHTCDDGGGGITTNTVWPANGSDSLWGHNCVSSYSPTGAYKTTGIPNLGLHAYYVR